MKNQCSLLSPQVMTERTLPSSKAVTANHRRDAQMPISSFPISSRSMFCTLLLAT
jgi:hypothetical protein